MTAKQKADLQYAEQEIERKNEQIDALQQEIADLEYELSTYRSAVSAVRWLWERAQEQKQFQP